MRLSFALFRPRGHDDPRGPLPRAANLARGDELRIARAIAERIAAIRWPSGKLDKLFPATEDFFIEDVSSGLDDFECLLSVF